MRNKMGEFSKMGLELDFWEKEEKCKNLQNSPKHDKGLTAPNSRLA